MRSAVAVANAPATGSTVVGSGRPAQSSSSSTTPAIAVACSARRRRPSESVRPDEATPTRLPTTTRRLIATLVSATFWWIWLLAKRVSAASSADDQGLRLGRAVAHRHAEGALGEVRVRPWPDRRSPAKRRRRLTTCRPRPGRRGTARPGRRGRRGRSGPARPCRSWACRASRSCARRRPRRTTARTRR